MPFVAQVAVGKLAELKIFGDDYDTVDGTGVRDYIHVEDLAAAHLLALEKAEPGTHRIYNLGNGNGFSVREVIEAAKRVTGLEIPVVEAPRRAGDPPMLVAASDLVRAELGWSPARPELEGMISDAWQFAQQRPRGYSPA
jgi:UDP-glucose 4-epimerase